MASEMAYIAVTSTGFVDGACRCNEEDSAVWVREMEHAGMAIQQVPLGEAKSMLFTQRPQTILVA